MECITDQSNWSGPFSLVVVCSLYNLGVVSSIPGRVLDKIFFTDFSPPTRVVPGARMITLGAQGRSDGCGVKSTWIIIISFPLH